MATSRYLMHAEIYIVPSKLRDITTPYLTPAYLPGENHANLQLLGLPKLTPTYERSREGNFSIVFPEIRPVTSSHKTTWSWCQ